MTRWSPGRIGSKRKFCLQEVLRSRLRRVRYAQSHFLGVTWRCVQGRDRPPLNNRPILFEFPRALHEGEIAEQMLVPDADLAICQIDGFDPNRLIDLLHL